MSVLTRCVAQSRKSRSGCRRHHPFNSDREKKRVGTQLGAERRSSTEPRLKVHLLAGWLGDQKKGGGCATVRAESLHKTGATVMHILRDGTRGFQTNSQQ